MNGIILKAEKRVDLEKFVGVHELKINLQLSHVQEASMYNYLPKSKPPGPGYPLAPERRGYDRVYEREAHRKQLPDSANVRVDFVSVNVKTRNV